MGGRNRCPCCPTGKLGTGRSAVGGKALVPGGMGGSRQHGGGMNVEQAVFLVGGLGTRLHKLPGGTAKPVLDVGGRPFLDHLLAEANPHGLKIAPLLSGYRASGLIAP